jgi:uncharacterized membrane protein
MAIASALAAALLLRLDSEVSQEWLAALPWIYSATAEGGRSVLSVIAGSMITVTGVVFSITIVALTLASSQFGPRLLRNFMRDRANQTVMGTFVATFLFSLIVLRAIESGDTPFVPHLSMAVAAGLGVVSLFVLIFFIHHAASSIQVSEIIRAVALEIEHALPSIFPESIGEETPIPPSGIQSLEAKFTDAWPVRAEAEGYVRVIDSDGLVGLATEHDLVLWLESEPGCFVSPQGEIARVYGCDASESVAARVRAAFAVGSQRTGVQDLPFLAHQLTEMAVRALSPGINDPQTAVACVERLGVVIHTLATRVFPSAYRQDEAGSVRVITAPTRFDSFVVSMLGPIRHYGAGDVDVAMALLRAVGESIAVARGERASFLETYFQEIVAAGRENIRVPSDRSRLEEQARKYQRAGH